MSAFQRHHQPLKSALKPVSTSYRNADECGKEHMLTFASTSNGLVIFTLLLVTRVEHQLEGD